MSLLAATADLALPSPPVVKLEKRMLADLVVASDASSAEVSMLELEYSNPALELFNGPYGGPLAMPLGNLNSSDLYSFWMSDPNMELPLAFLSTRRFTIRHDLDTESMTRSRIVDVK